MPVPDTAQLPENQWTKLSELVGVDMNGQGQINLLKIFSMYREEYDKFPITKTTTPYQYFIHNKSFESVDGEVLYCMIRHFKPKKILEIGSGFSTMLSAQAIHRNKVENSSYYCKLEVVDPYATEIIRAGFPGLTKLNLSKAQDTPLSSFQNLGKDDFLFIDSSHVLKIGSDVQYLFLEVFPRLKPGVIIHIHDVFIPSEYPRNLVLKEHLFWSEQHLLQAFLAFNTHFRVLWGGSYMHLKHPELLEASFKSYTRNAEPPGSFWMKRID